MIKTFHARDYGCLKDVTAQLTPLHAFIGPNDSGKSTLLRGVRTALQFAGGTFTDVDKPFDPGIGLATSVLSIDLTLSDGTWYGLSRADDGFTEAVEAKGVARMSARRLALNVDGLLRANPTNVALRAIGEELRPARLLRLDPDSLREPSDIIQEGTPVDFDDRGEGLPGVYDYIMSKEIEAFLSIVGEVRHLFPAVAKVGLNNLGGAQKELEIALTSGRRVPARFMSEGLLYYLAFAAIRFLAPTSVVLIEEPENGLHPARIAEVMRVLREVSKTTQVLIATHSPLVINEMEPDEVSIVTRTETEGTAVKLIKDTPDFEARSKVYALGELWIAYANGNDEGPLLEGREP